MFLGRGCIIFIFLNLPVPGFAGITSTTISEKLSSNFCELKIRRGNILKYFSKKVISAFISFREVFTYV